MDPDIILRDLRQAIEDWEVHEHCNIDGLIDSIDALDKWLTMGGFLPKDWRQ